MPIQAYKLSSQIQQAAGGTEIRSMWSAAYRRRIEVTLYRVTVHFGVFLLAARSSFPALRFGFIGFFAGYFL
jgi:hypothetical protein